MGKFKKGDEVRVTNAVTFRRGTKIGDRGVVTDVRNSAIFIDLHHPTEGAIHQIARADNIEHALTIEPGKHYRLRNGKVTGRVSQGDIGFEALVDGQVKVFDKAGGAVFGGEDIVEAWVPKVGERVIAKNRGYEDGRNEGVVKEIDNHDSLLVEFADGWTDGHDGNLDDGQYTRWWHNENEIEPLLVAAPAQPAVWVPAVGDKVVWLEPFKASMYTKGKEYLIHKKDSHGALCITDDNDNPNHTWSNDSILRSFSLAVPLQIQQGKFYKTRDGRKVGPMSRHNDGWAVGRRGNMWIDTGERYFKIDRGGDSDLVSEWVDEPVAASNDNAAPSKPKFKVGDRVLSLISEVDVVAGKIYEIVEIDDDGDIRVRDDTGYPWLLADGEFELVAEPLETLNLTVTADTEAVEAAFDRIIAKLERIAELQEQLGLRAA